jgi:hypothetical protein
VNTNTPKITPSTMYRLRAGQGVIRTTDTVAFHLDGRILASESYEFIYQPYEQDPTLWWTVKRSDPASGWEPVPTYPLNVADIWTEIQIVPATVKETEVTA